MNARRSAVVWIRIALAALAVGLFARYLANVGAPVTTRAQSPHPTSTWTPTPEGQTTPTNTPTPVPPTNTPTPVPPTNTPTPVPPTNTPLPPTDTPVPLDCSHAEPSIETLWPPNHQFVAISVLGMQPEVTVVIDSIFQDEAVHTPGSGSTAPDGQGVGTATAEVRAERDGGGNGRVYLITFTATDGHGDTCSGGVVVTVPQSNKQAEEKDEDEPQYDSTVVTP